MYARPHEFIPTRSLPGYLYGVKTDMGWFFSLKFHLMFNDHGELLNFIPDHVNNRKHVPDLSYRRLCKLIGNKGYLSKALWDERLCTFVPIPVPTQMTVVDEILMSTSAIVEPIIDQLKDIAQIAHSYHFSLINVLVNLLVGVMAGGH